MSSSRTSIKDAEYHAEKEKSKLAERMDGLRCRARGAVLEGEMPEGGLAGRSDQRKQGATLRDLKMAGTGWRVPAMRQGRESPVHNSSGEAVWVQDLDAGRRLRERRLNIRRRFFVRWKPILCEIQGNGTG